MTAARWADKVVPTMSPSNLGALQPVPAGASNGPEESNRSLPLVPIVAFVAVWLGGSGLIVGAGLRSVIPGGWWTVVAVLALSAVPVAWLIRGLQGAAYPSAATRILVLRPFWYAMLFMPLLAAATLAGGLAGLPFGASGAVGRWALTAASVTLAVAALVGYVGSLRLAVRRVEVRLPRLPEAFDGLRVVQVSDLHVGPHTSPRFLKKVAESIQQAEPDLIVVTGDQVDDFAADVEIFADAFTDLRAPFGTVAVIGNHDVYADWRAVRRGLVDAGITVLVNEAIAIEREGDRLWIAGTGDPAAAGWPKRGARRAAPDIDRTLAHVPAEETVVALSHNPALWPALADRQVDLTLSGHTHYGQFAIPRRSWSMASPFLDLAMGWHRRDRSLLYIHPGTNYWGIPFRIGTPPEVTVLTLRAGDAAEVGARP